ncbi:MAG: hypothetical protein ABSA46_22030 [Thermodesulfovibrionales bacterium]|jgi:hypothetical protein
MLTGKYISPYSQLRGCLRYDRNIRRPQDLKVMLDENGLEISYPSAYALFHYQPMRITIKGSDSF